MAHAMVLGAGFGNRLRPLTDELPKPLLPYGDRSLLERALATLRSLSLGERVVVNVHHLASEFERRLASFGAGVELVHEPKILGTAGGIAGARSKLEAPLIVMVGDVVLERVPHELAKSVDFGGLALAVAPRARGSGSVGIGAAGELVRLRGEVFGIEVAGGDYVGLAALGAQALAELPSEGCLFGDYALPLLRRGGRVATCAYESEFIAPSDDLASFLAANLRWLERKKLRSYVDAGAKIDKAVELEAALVLGDARISGSGRVERSLVLAGAVCNAPLNDAIVLPSGTMIFPTKPWH